jgi:hypothetical protein
MKKSFGPRGTGEETGDHHIFDWGLLRMEAAKKLAECTRQRTAAGAPIWLDCKGGHPAAFSSPGID